jgi:hypothetical protein
MDFGVDFLLAAVRDAVRFLKHDDHSPISVKYSPMSNQYKYAEYAEYELYAKNTFSLHILHIFNVHLFEGCDERISSSSDSVVAAARFGTGFTALARASRSLAFSITEAFVLATRF